MKLENTIYNVCSLEKELYKDYIGFNLKRVELKGRKL